MRGRSGLWLPFAARHRLEPPFNRSGPRILRSWYPDLGDLNVASESLLDKLLGRGDRWRAEQNLRRDMALSAAHAGPFAPRASGLGWEEVIYTPIADGSPITGSSEALTLPDFNIPASYLTVGKILKYTIMGRQSTVITTPGTITHRLRWGGLAGVSVVASGAFAPDPTAAATNLTFMVEWWMQCRTVGTGGTAMGWGRIEWTDYDDASAAALVGNLNMRMAPTATPAVATIDTTIDKLLSVTYQSNVTTASMTAHVGILEACN